MRTAYAPPRHGCPMTRCDWAVATGKPEGRQEWADVHLQIAEMLAEHLRDDHHAGRTCKALGKGVGGTVLDCQRPYGHDGDHRDSESHAAWQAVSA